MTRFIILIFFLCLSCTLAFSQTADSTQNYLFWSEDYRLVWTDFDEFPDRKSEHGALSIVGHLCEFEMDNVSYKAIIRTYFDRNNSWARNWVPILLAHEQGHFDLAEVYARKFRKRVLAEMKGRTLTVKRFEELNSEIDQALKKAHNVYDEATNYSLNYGSQMQWNKKITQWLTDYADYSNPVIESRRK